MNYRNDALDLLKSRRQFRNSPMEWEWRTIAAWKYLQMSMGKPPRLWTTTPPRVTVTGEVQ